MNHKQKLGYMVLGAGILALGITIGQFVTPAIEAQSNGVFDEITCRSLNVVDKNGNAGIQLLAVGDTNLIVIGNNSPGTGRIYLGTDHGTNGITITNGAGDSAIELKAKEHQNHVQVLDKTGKPAILLGAYENENSVFVMRKVEEGSVKLMGTKDKSSVFIGDRSKADHVGLVAAEDGNLIFLNGKAGEESINLLASEREGASIIIVDRAGNPAWSTP